jgi:HD-GYP domain-containing protein (c-di-GMP phosphodiesterase class II)
MSDDTFMNSTVLNDRREGGDDRSKEIGPVLCSKLIRLLKSGEIFSIEHDQTAEAAEDLVEFINAALAESDNTEMALQMTEHNFFLDGVLIPIDQRSHDRIHKLRETFIAQQANVITFSAGVAVGEFLQLLDALADPEKTNLDGFLLPHIELQLVVEDQDDVGKSDDERREIIELYAGLLIRCRMYFSRVVSGMNPSTRGIKRLVQRITDRIDEHGDVFIGLMHMKLMQGRDFVHAANCAVYSMILADAVGLSPLDIVRCGMTAIAQDVDKLDSEQPDEQMEVGDGTHYRTNMTSVTVLSQTGTRDVLSALRLVTNYERGFPYNKPLPKTWYQDELTPHVLSRIVEVARDYDILTQGLEGLDAMKPDLALQALMEKMGSHYDPLLVKLFINAIGIYPVGSVVELSDGRRALVIKNAKSVGAEGLSQATRPVVRLLDGTEEIIDLGKKPNAGLYIEHILSDDEVEQRPGAFLLF